MTWNYEYVYKSRRWLIIESAILRKIYILDRDSLSSPVLRNAIFFTLSLVFTVRVTYLITRVTVVRHHIFCELSIIKISQGPTDILEMFSRNWAPAKSWKLDVLRKNFLSSNVLHEIFWRITLCYKKKKSVCHSKLTGTFWYLERHKTTLRRWIFQITFGMWFLQSSSWEFLLFRSYFFICVGFDGKFWY